VKNTVLFSMVSYKCFFDSCLSAQVYTVKDRSELDMVVPCPQEEIQLYNAPAPNQLETQKFGLALAAIMEKVKDLPNMLNLFVECLEISWGP
jgi:hypothetical protein